MPPSVSDTAAARSPLEEFVRDYVDVAGGAWDEVEPQVYDVLLPADAADAPTEVRLAFDPEALPDHPGAQLASFGTPLLDKLLAGAVARGRLARFYLVGLNLAPHDLAGRARRALSLAPGLELRLERVRALHFAQAVYGFQATFVSEQREQEIVPVAFDLHSAREVRHLEALLDRARLTEQPSLPLPEARRLSVAAAYPEARARVLRTLAPLANSRARELHEQLERQVARMGRYYGDLRAEQAEQRDRAATRGEDLAKLDARVQAVDREERLRVAELRQKGALRVQLRLLSLVVVQQPKLLLRGGAASAKQAGAPLELVWDPLVEAIEPVPCPACQRPTLTLALSRQGQLVCPDCEGRDRRGRP